MANLPDDIYRPETDNGDSAREILMITADNTEDIEFFYPYYRFIEAGFKVDVATPNGGAFKGKHGLGLKNTIRVTDANSEDYELLYLPGGAAPEKLKKNEDVIALATRFLSEGKPISAVCHGPQILAAAEIINGRKIAAWPEVEDEIRAAGATYANEETVIDGPFITARRPGDLPMHLKRTLALLGKTEKTVDASTEAA